ncbi:hypothetical protein [Reinekea marinisedimentorum]|uniref:Uncharacterized protein n=1 Tax=Reinekea marinisedimentorum TaxID=230495 RepID=A0A4R3I3F0_9GAMM|nr:hypothetical protein [Reinekea marinisedimentorum]TCS40344.1 hypothetical protein BCF53_10953 [Reinekea marinisedimentorum]
MRSMKASLAKLCLPLLLLAGCGSSSDDPLNYDGVLSAAELYSYDTRTNSDALVECSVIYLQPGSCDLSKVQPLGMGVSGDVSESDVASRLVVSHDWMADSFLDALDYIDDQNLLNLFKAVNTIVISYEIDGSFYHAYTASIYIDPRYLWRNTEEWETINDEDDSCGCSEYPLQFYPARRFVDAGSGDYSTWSNSYNSETYNYRYTYQLAPKLYSLLAHELAHANDFVPPELLASLGSSGTIYDYIYSNTRVSSDLDELYPLSSDLVMEAADVYYNESEASAGLIASTGEDIGLEFEDDGASYFYSYTNSREDLATLVEISMMYLKYGAVLDVGFTNIPDVESPECDDYLIEWGQRHRLADADVNNRAAYVAGRIISADYALEISSITDETIAIEAGSGWCSSRYDTDVAVSSARSIQSRSRSTVVHDFQDDFVVEGVMPEWP